MYQTSKDISNGLVFSKSKVNQVNEKYVKLYAKRCYELYDLGYLSTPSVFDETEFIEALVDEYPDCIKKLISGLNKNMIKTSIFMKYVASISDDKEFNNIILKYGDILDCQKVFNDLSTLVNKVKFKKRSDTVIAKPYIITSTCIFNDNNIPFDSEFVRECLVVDEGYHLQKFDLGEIWLKNIAFEIGLSEDEFNYCKFNGKSLFSDKLSFKDDLTYLDIIITGDINENTENTRKLHNKILDVFKNKTLSDSFKTFKEYLFMKVKDEIDAKVKEIKSNMSDYSCFYFTYNSLILKVKGVSEAVNEETFDVGNFVYDNINKVFLNVYNNLKGFSGEFVDENYIVSNNYVVTGLPVELVNFDNYGRAYTGRYYPIFNINNLYPKVNKINVLDEDKILKKLQITQLNQIKNCIKENVDENVLNQISEYLIVLLKNACGEDISVDASYSDEVMFYTDKYYRMVMSEVLYETM